MSEAALEYVLEGEGLDKEFQGGDGGIIRVLDEVSISVRRGEMVAIVGESGAGKSTLLHVLGALERPSAGRIRLAGQAVEGLAEETLDALRNRTVGFVFQFHHLLREFSALENVMMPLRIAGETIPRAKERAMVLLERVGLASRVHHRPGALSGGEQQRVSIARAFVNRPLILLADEPTGNLDPATGEGIMALLDEINQTGTTVVMATHDHRVVNAMRRRVIQLDRGVIVRDQERGVYE